MWITVWSAGRLGNQFLGEACVPFSSLDLTDPGQRWYQLHDFVETGVVLPPNLTSAPSTLSRSGQSSAQHRTRSNAFSRSPTPASPSRRDSTKSTASDDHERESGSQSSISTPSKLVLTPSPPRRASAESEQEVGKGSGLIIPQGEKRDSSDSIIPLIKVEEQKVGEK